MTTAKQSPIISVITVVYNGAACLEQAIRSVIEQQCDSLEYIIIDGGSTDGTPDIIDLFEDHIDCVVSEKDNGIFDAMNKGIEKANGKFIGFLNADDFYEPGILNKVKDRILSEDLLQKNSIVYFHHYSLDEELSGSHKKQERASMKYWRGMTISHQAMFVHRDLFETFGSFDLQYHYACDYEFFLRLIKAGITFEEMDVFGVNFRKGGISTQQMNRSISEVSRIVRRYFGVFSKQYPLFLLTNRLPSMVGNLRILLSKVIGKDNTNKLRRLKRGIK